MIAILPKEWRVFQNIPSREARRTESSIRQTSQNYRKFSNIWQVLLS